MYQNMIESYQGTNQGNLYFRFIGDDEDRRLLRDAIESHGTGSVEAEIFADLGFSTLDPCEVGALTDGAIIDNGLHAFWDEAYQVRSIAEDLANGKEPFLLKVADE